MTKKIIAINSGSSSLKFQLFEMPEEKLITKGLFERIGLSCQVDFSCTTKSQVIKEKLPIQTHKEAIDYLLTFLIKNKLINHLSEIKGVGHRVAHGGEYFRKSSVITAKEQKIIEDLSGLAPLHNPINLIGIKAFQEKLPNCPQIGVFDTSFHQTIEPKDYIYPIPYKYYEEDKIRRYGFHGTSHQFVAEEAAKVLGRSLENLNLIVCHIGNGASICGIKQGKSKLTSMGFTPLAGLMMGTRCGDIDPSIVTYLQEEKGLGAKEVLEIMNEQSGLLGVSKISNDSRDILEAVKNDDLQADLAMEMYAGKIRQTIGAYLSELGRLDALIFTAGVGENSSLIREKVCKNLEVFNIMLDNKKNLTNDLVISSAESPIKIMVIPTNEELMIAKDTYKLSESVALSNTADEEVCITVV